MLVKAKCCNLLETKQLFCFTIARRNNLRLATELSVKNHAAPFQVNKSSK